MVDGKSEHDDSSDGLVGQTLAGRYVVETVVSAGAYTIITVALDQTTNQPVTVKVVRPEVVDRDGFGARFTRCCELSAALTHPNIASVTDFGEIDFPMGEPGRSTWFWVGEYLAGGSLRDLLDRGRLLDPSQALVVGLEACRALDVAHQRGIVHTEITPSKLVFGEDRRLRIVDFALAELLGEETWENPANVPTHVARYASPEQALGMEIDAKTDVYALSLSLIEAVTGSVPFAGDSTNSTLALRVGKLMPVSADLGSLAAVLERAGRPDSEDRSTAAEFGKGLVQAAQTLPRPEPIPLIATGLFTAGARPPARRPDGWARPPRTDGSTAPRDRARRTRPVNPIRRPRTAAPRADRTADRADRHRRGAGTAARRRPRSRDRHADDRRAHDRTHPGDADRCHRRRRCRSPHPRRR